MKIHYSEFGHNIISCNINNKSWTNTDDLTKVTCRNCLHIELKYKLHLQKNLREMADTNMQDISIIQIKLKSTKFQKVIL